MAGATFCRTVILGRFAARNTRSTANFPATAKRAIMQVVVEHQRSNPLSGLVSDEVFRVLEKHELLSEKGVRDYEIRRKFRQMRRQNVPAYDAIERLREDYAYLQFDTIRKIVYKVNSTRR